MANQPHTNGHPPRTNGLLQQGQRTSDGGRLRTISVREALPFTPFSSIVPFNPEIIPAPVATPPYNVDYGFGDHAGTRRVLDQLSAGATSAERASGRLKQTLDDVQKLLDPDALIEFQFKKPKIPTAKQPNASQVKFQPPKLSSFAQMSLDESEIQFRYLTPESREPSRKPVVNGPKQQKGHKELATSTIHPVVHIPQSNGTQPADDSEFAPSSQTLRAVIPSVLTPAQRAEYKYVDDSRVHQAKRQSMATPGRFISVDQRQKGDAAVQQLLSLLGEMFNAEDQMPSDPADASLTGAMQSLSYIHTDDGPVTVLQSALQERLDMAVQTVTKYSRLDGIPVEDLLRAQKISERAVSGATSTNLQIGDDWSQEDAQEWQERLGMADSALLASRTILRMMTAGRQEKELQSEDYVRSILDLMKNVIESGLVPVAEERSFVGEKMRGGDKPHANPRFAIATQYREALRILLQSITKSLRLLAGLLSRVDVDESAISSVVFMCKSLIFAENATSDKDSVFGIQLFEGTRKYAMDVIARTFTRYPTQRQFVIDEILVSLEKLPATKQSARQYRIPDAKPIQLVSALLMRLVQTSATRSSTAMHLRSKTENGDDNSDADSEAEDSDADAETDDEINVSPTKRGNASTDLGSLVKPLHDAATTDAAYIIRILIQRALTVSKSSDEPFRKLLDIFTEDFMNVLGSSDWPAAELLLRLMLLQMMNIVREPSTPVGPKNLALELMGTLASGILQLQASARNAASNVNASESGVASSLVSLFEQIESGDVDSNAFTDFNGPYRVVLEHLHARDTGGDAQLQTARGFHLIQWSQQVAGGRASSVDYDGGNALNSHKDLEGKLRNMVLDPQWLEEHHDAWSVSTQVSRLASSLIVLNSTFCRAFSNIFKVLVAAMSDEHPTVRSRALRSVVIVLEKDASVFDRNRSILRDILRTTEDSSALVRDAAVGIIAKCLSMRPALDGAVLEDMIKRTRDAAPGVRKKAMKLLKEIYLRNESTSLRSSIANAIIARIEDAEETVSELARVTIEEIWFAPYYGLSLQGENAVRAKLQYRSQAALLIQTANLGDSVLPVLESLVREVLTKSKTAPANIRVCKILVGVLFDGIIDPVDIPDSPSQDIILETLTVFAKAYPTLVDSAQIERLEPYTKNLTSNDDLAVYRSVLAILRHTMPHIPTLQQGFLQNIQNSLLGSMSKLPKTEIAEVAACLWTIDGELKNTFRLVNLIASALTNIRAMKGEDFSADPKKVNRIIKLMAIVGQFGKACDFEGHIADFRDKLAQPKAKSVAGLAIEILCSFTSPKQPLNIREASLDAICAICQRWPKQFLRADVSNTVDRILKDRDPTLEHIFVGGLEGFFATLNVPTEGQDGADGTATETGRERLAKTYIATDQDGASSELAQRFLQDILRLATSSFDDLALTATKLIASILQQGLPHPKECGPSLVALETSPNQEIARIAFVEHRTMHQKHETTVEKEYIRAVQKSFEYQERVAGSPVGFTGSPTVSKLRFFFEVLKGGKGKVRHKFLNNISQRLEFDPAELDVRAAIPVHLAFARYCCENVAFFEYGDTNDLFVLIPALEKVFSGVGTAIAQVIESDILKLYVEEVLGAPPMANGTAEPTQSPTAAANIDPARLRSLAVSAQILLVIWATRTFLKNVYNLRNLLKSKGKALKESSGKPPTRVTNAPTFIEAYIKRIAHIMACPPTPEAQRNICNEFVEVINVDNDAKVPSEEEEDAELDGADTGSESASHKSPSTTPSKGRKRKSVGSAQGGAPRKRGRPPGGGKRKPGSARVMDEDEDGVWD